MHRKCLIKILFKIKFYFRKLRVVITTEAFFGTSREEFPSEEFPNKSEEFLQNFEEFIFARISPRHIFLVVIPTSHLLARKTLFVSRFGPIG